MTTTTGTVSETQRSIVWISILLVFAKFVAFLREAVAAHFFGTSRDYDVFQLSLAAATVMFGFFERLISVAVLPVLAGRASDGHSKLAASFGDILRVLVAVAFLAAAATVVLAPLLVDAFGARNFTPADRTRAVDLLRLLTGYGTLSILCLSVGAFLNAQQRFIIPRFESITVNSTVVIVLVVFASTLGVDSLALGFTLGYLVFLVYPLGPNLRGVSFRGRLVTEDTREVARLALPLLVSFGLEMVGSAVEKNLASARTEGTLSALSYASRLLAFISAFLFTWVVSVVTTRLSRAFAAGDRGAAATILARSIEGLLAVAIPVCVLIVVGARPMVRALFQRGSFGAGSVDLTAEAFLFLGVGVVPMTVAQLYYFAVVSLRRTRTLVAIHAVSLVSYVVANLILSELLGLAGICLALSFFYLVQSSLLFWFVRGQLPGIIAPRFGLKVMVIAAASGLAAAATLLAWSWVGDRSAIVTLVVVLGVYMMVFITLVLAWRALATAPLRIEAYDILLRFFRSPLGERPR